MGKGSATSTSQDNNKGNGSGDRLNLVLECETEDLSDAQLTRIQSLKDEALRLQKLIQNSTKQKANEITTTPTLVNGTGIPSVTTALTNGPSVVGLQVPQFLILQNGQMLATSSALQPTSINSTNPASTFPISSVPGSINPTLTFKTTTSRGHNNQLTTAVTRPQIRVVPLESVSTGKKSNDSSPAVSTASTAVVSAAPATSISNNSDDIQVLSELRVSAQGTSAASRSLRDVRIPLASGSTSATSSATNLNTVKTASTSSASGSNDIIAMSSGNSVTSTRTSTNTAASTNVTSLSSTTSSASSNISLKYPMLNVIARPRNTLPPAVAMCQRKELDTRVKLVLVKSPQEFVEWLLSKGLIRTSQSCTVHKVQHTQQPYRLKLGMFSDPKALATSGGYVWISECCGKKYVSVYSGSIFGSTPIDKVAPTSVLKLVYHWSCQTSISNVENWVKVEKTFINKIFQYLRCVCSVMLQDKVYDFGFDATTVELGIVSLGTSTADGTKKAVKVEILGLYDRKMKSYRLFASEPEPGSSSRQRFIRILKPLENVVHTNALILCDQSVDRNCLYNMSYTRVNVCETSEIEDSPQFNAKIMAYLRRHVPKMFQSALSQLNLQQVQLVLDELCWRERYGHCAAQAYNNMIEHITYLTAREAENPGVLHLLDYVANNPLRNWRYKTQHTPKGPTTLQPSIIMNPASTNTSLPTQLIMDPSTVAQTPLEHNNKVLLTTRKVPVPPVVSPTNTVSIPSLNTKQESTELEPFYYGQIQGDTTLGHELNSTKFICHICQEECENNIAFYTHLKIHLNRSASYSENKLCCDYCLDIFSSQEKKIFHQRVKHMHLDGRLLWCRICTEGFSSEYNLVNHMAKKHYESELPYRCEVCNFVTSIFYSLIDHFNNEHKNTSYVQCHFCLSVSSITPTSASTFPQRMYQHMQKHLHQQTRCKQCQLVFFTKHFMDEHKRKDHISRFNFPGLQRFKIPAGQKTRLMFRPWIKRQSPAGSPKSSSQSLAPPVALSSTLQWHDLKMEIPDPEDHRCLECFSKLSLSDHFKSYMKCTRCSYSTCCRYMITRHAEGFHPQGRTKKKKYKIGHPIILPKPLFCICGFSSRSGNHLARHLMTCEGGRKSAYPSVSDAMVYQGDLTNSMLSLASLSFDTIGTLASVIPDTPLVLPDTSLQPPTLDMTHFMSVSMDVDET